MNERCKANAFSSTNEQERFYEDKNLTLRLFSRPLLPCCSARLTDDPRDAVALTRHAFSSSRRQLQNIGSQTAIATVLIAAVLRAGLASA